MANVIHRTLLETAGNPMLNVFLYFCKSILNTAQFKKKCLNFLLTSLGLVFLD